MIKAFFASIRYHYRVSGVLVFFLTPVYRFCNWVRNHIEKKIKVNGATLRYDSTVLRFPKNVGVGFCSAIYWKGEKGFEPYTWKAIKGASKDADFFLDIGSNFGFYSVMVRKTHPSVNTICFEPFPAIYHDNIAFHKANGLEPLTIVNKAVSNVAGTTTLFVPKITFISDVRSATLEQNFFYNRNMELIEQKIETITLDSLTTTYKQLNTGNVFIKIDVEGHERAVLEGGREFFKAIRPVVVCEVDLIPETLEFLSGYLETLRYTCFGISPTGLIQLRPMDFAVFNSGRDFLFIPDEKLIFKNFLSWKAFEKVNFWKKDMKHQNVLS
jgi:FkbM family methyltransferase